MDQKRGNSKKLEIAKETAHPDNRHATIDATQYYNTQAALPSVASPIFVEKDWSPFDTHDKV